MVETRQERIKDLVGIFLFYLFAIIGVIVINQGLCNSVESNVVYVSQ